MLHLSRFSVGALWGIIFLLVSPNAQAMGGKKSEETAQGEDAQKEKGETTEEAKADVPPTHDPAQADPPPETEKPKTTAEAHPAPESENQPVKALSKEEALNQKIVDLETKLTMLADKVDALANSKNLETTGIPMHPAENAGKPVHPETSTAKDPENSLTNDDAVQSYRKAMILFHARKYPEAVLAFSSFIQGYPDHALAGAAQFHVGESYLRQREYKLAVQEFQRVLTSYDRSSYIADTLRQMSIAEDQASKGGDAAKHRQLLESLFPQSPAAGKTAEEEKEKPTRIQTGADAALQGKNDHDSEAAQPEAHEEPKKLATNSPLGSPTHSKDAEHEEKAHEE